MRHDIRTEIDIEAPPEEVWPHLVDLTAYADWNPFITSATGSAEEGRRLSLRMEPPGGRAATVHPRGTQGAPRPRAPAGEAGVSRRRSGVARPPGRPGTLRRPAPLRTGPRRKRDPPG